MIRDIYKSSVLQWRVILALMMREIHTRYGRENIGFLWVIGEPILFCAGVTIVWSAIRPAHEHGIPVPAFVVTGYIPLTMWRHCVGRAVKAFEANGSLLFHRHVSPLDIITARVILEVMGTIMAGIIVAAATILVGAMDVPLRPDLLYLGLGFHMAFCYASALIISALSERSELVEKTITVVMYLVAAALRRFHHGRLAAASGATDRPMVAERPQLGDDTRRPVRARRPPPLRCRLRCVVYGVDDIDWVVAYLAGSAPHRRPMIRCVDIVKDYRVHKGVRRVLNNINFEIHPGQKFGILGRNGAGKSTLIKIIGGVEIPTSGHIERTMSVSWPLAFGGAFQGSLSGLDNLKFICRIYGLAFDSTRRFVDDFAELGAQLAEPVKTYSSGMRARLAFALSIAIEFECYLIDEVIMVGDARFLERCKAELFSRRSDRALILVSHDMSFITDVCDSAAVIHDSVLTQCESVDAAIKFYHEL